MPRYFFDVDDTGDLQQDDTGTELADLDAARKMAMRALPDIARQDIPKDGDRRTFTVLVTAEDGQPVYAATLTYSGLWLQR